MSPPNKAMKLTSLSAAPGLNGKRGVDGGAASCPRGLGTAGTGSQLIASVERTPPAATGGKQRSPERCSCGPDRLCYQGVLRVRGLAPADVWRRECGAPQ